jgi:hypothetical protein
MSLWATILRLVTFLRPKLPGQLCYLSLLLPRYVRDYQMLATVIFKIDLPRNEILTT